VEAVAVAAVAAEAVTRAEEPTRDGPIPRSSTGWRRSGPAPAAQRRASVDAEARGTAARRDEVRESFWVMQLARAEPQPAELGVPAAASAAVVRLLEVRLQEARPRDARARVETSGARQRIEPHAHATRRSPFPGTRQPESRSRVGSVSVARTPTRRSAAQKECRAGSARRIESPPFPLQPGAGTHPPRTRFICSWGSPILHGPWRRW
jgi:hypothetical protein